ncbi:MAG: hypothetical protein JRN39_05885 [Nitrososphaerota archaeon]|nr:hypothetical protein [Nitrososphaerota archaeon]MDG6939911.1 hypothetical protein [Nitrososphaerota archaeon]
MTLTLFAGVVGAVMLGASLAALAASEAEQALATSGTELASLGAYARAAGESASVACGAGAERALLSGGPFDAAQGVSRRLASACALAVGALRFQATGTGVTVRALNVSVSASPDGRTAILMVLQVTARKPDGAAVGLRLDESVEIPERAVYYQGLLRDRALKLASLPGGTAQGLNETVSGALVRQSVYVEEDGTVEYRISLTDSGRCLFVAADYDYEMYVAGTVQPAGG